MDSSRVKAKGRTEDQGISTPFWAATRPRSSGNGTDEGRSRPERAPVEAGRCDDGDHLRMARCPVPARGPVAALDSAGTGPTTASKLYPLPGAPLKESSYRLAVATVRQASPVDLACRGRTDCRTTRDLERVDGRPSMLGFINSSCPPRRTMADSTYEDDESSNDPEGFLSDETLFPHTDRLRTPDGLAALEKAIGGPIARIRPPSDEATTLQTVTLHQLHEYTGLSDDATLLASLTTLPAGAVLGVLGSMVTAGSGINVGTAALIVVLLLWGAVLGALTFKKHGQVKEARARLVPHSEGGGASRK